MREKVVHTKMAKECSRQKEEQVRSPEAGTSSERVQGRQKEGCATGEEASVGEL